MFKLCKVIFVSPEFVAVFQFNLVVLWLGVRGIFDSEKGNKKLRARNTEKYWSTDKIKENDGVRLSSEQTHEGWLRYAFYFLVREH